ncbi:MAG: hypothetical protein ABI216_22135 [Devosia sp.]
MTDKLPEEIKQEDGKPSLTVERRVNWALPSWLLSGLFTVCVAIAGVALTMWSNESVQDMNIEYVMKQIEEVKAENRALKQDIGANKLHLENFSSEALDMMRRLNEQDRFRKPR